jgi:antitoxin component YwqK of YwqJK toxin-antitoxin module
MPEKRSEIIDGFTIKYHANGITHWSKGVVIDGKPEGYWEWYRINGTIKRSGHFKNGIPTESWTTYDQNDNIYKVTMRQGKSAGDKNYG